MSSSTIKAYLWDVSGKIGVQLSGFIIGIFIARILTPAEYGKIGAAMIFLAISDIFTNMGLGSALIQKKNPENIHYSSTFFLNVFASLIFFIFFFTIAPLIENFLLVDGLTEIIQVLSISLIISGFTIVYEILLIKELKFKLISQAKFLSSIISGIIGVTLAYYGYGVWSLVFQQITQKLILLICYWFVTSWKPRLQFSISAIKELWTYSGNMFLSGIINTIYGQVDSLVITKLFSNVELGLYSRAKSLNNFVVKYAYESIGVVTFPVMAKLQDKQDKMVQMGLLIEKVVAFISFGMLGWLYLTASSFITILLGQKWSEIIPIYKLLCLSGFAYPLSAATLNMLKAIGDSKTFLKVEIFKKVVGLLSLIIGFSFGMKGFLISLIVSGAISVWLNMYFTGKSLDIKVKTQLIPLIQYLIFAVFGVFISNYLIEFINITNQYVEFLSSTTIFVSIYLLFNALNGSVGLNFILNKFKTNTSKS